MERRRGLLVDDRDAPPPGPITAAQSNIFRSVPISEALRRGFRRLRRDKEGSDDPLGHLKEPLLLREREMLLSAVEEHAEADTVFFDSDECTSVDTFIHTCDGAPLARQSLALRMHVNLSAACLASACVFGIGLAALSPWRESLSNLGGAHVNLLVVHVVVLVLLPWATFVVTLLAAHELPCWLCADDERAWIASLCLHETRQNLRARALSALPEFISAADRLLVLANETSFARPAAWMTLTSRLSEHNAMLMQLLTPSYTSSQLSPSPAAEELSGVALIEHLGIEMADLSGGYAAPAPTTAAAALVAGAAPERSRSGGEESVIEESIAALEGAAKAAADGEGENGVAASIMHGAAAAIHLEQQDVVAEALAPWLAAELAPCLVKRLGSAQDLVAMPLALLAVLPGIALAAINSFDCDGFGCTKAAAVPARDFLAVQAAAIPIALLASPLPLPLALGFIRGARSLACRCCCSSRCVEFGVNVVASAIAYTLGCVVASTSVAFLVPACFSAKREESSAALAAFGISLLAALALHSLLFARSHPRSVLGLALLACALFGAIAAETYLSSQRTVSN